MSSLTGVKTPGGSRGRFDSGATALTWHRAALHATALRPAAQSWHGNDRASRALPSSTAMNAPKISTKPPSGMRDFLPADIARRQHVIDVVRRIYGSYGFVPLETPAIENLSTVAGQVRRGGRPAAVPPAAPAGRAAPRARGRAPSSSPTCRRRRAGRPARTRAARRGPTCGSTRASWPTRACATTSPCRWLAWPRSTTCPNISSATRSSRCGAPTGRARAGSASSTSATSTSPARAASSPRRRCAARWRRSCTRSASTDFKIRINHRQLLRAMMHHAGIDVAHEAAALVAIDKLDKVGHGGVLEELATCADRHRGGQQADDARCSPPTASSCSASTSTRSPRGRRRRSSGCASRSPTSSGCKALAELDGAVRPAGGDAGRAAHPAQPRSRRAASATTPARSSRSRCRTSPAASAAAAATTTSSACSARAGAGGRLLARPRADPRRSWRSAGCSPTCPSGQTCCCAGWRARRASRRCAWPTRCGARASRSRCSPRRPSSASKLQYADTPGVEGPRGGDRRRRGAQGRTGHAQAPGERHAGARRARGAARRCAALLRQ